ncbi:MAG: hypothetical protein MJ232_03520 [archaeon]|mgnify:CR=1 FL=1|nr:hypothetical protein [archaeon]
MEMTREERDRIKDELRDKLNVILEKNDLPYRVDRLSVMNISSKISFLGNVRVHDKDKVKTVLAEVEELVNQYGKTTINTRDVIPCCELPYTYINFHIDIPK